MAPTFKGSARCLLVFLLVSGYCDVDAWTEYIDPQAPTNVKGVIGEKVEIPCILTTEENLDALIWIKKPDQILLPSGYTTFIDGHRFGVSYGWGERTSYLTIEDSKKQDEGSYQCVFNSTYMNINLTMIEDDESRRWRTDNRCGAYYNLRGALSSTPAECDPDGAYPCCSGSNWCGFTVHHCDCSICVDYRLPRETNEPEAGTFTENYWRTYEPAYFTSAPPPPVAGSCFVPFRMTAGKCVLHLSSESLNWADAEEYCRSYESHLITFSSLDQLVEVAANITTTDLLKGVGDDGVGIWVGFSTQGRQVGDQAIEWRWETGDRKAPLSLPANIDPGDICVSLHSHTLNEFSIIDGCEKHKMPLCEKDLK